MQAYLRLITYYLEVYIMRDGSLAGRRFIVLSPPRRVLVTRKACVSHASKVRRAANVRHGASVRHKASGGAKWVGKPHECPPRRERPSRPKCPSRRECPSRRDRPSRSEHASATHRQVLPRSLKRNPHQATTSNQISFMASVTPPPSVTPPESSGDTTWAGEGRTRDVEQARGCGLV